MKDATLIQLEKLGIRRPRIATYPWGLYWHEEVSRDGPVKTHADMRNGHIATNGDIYEWPGTDSPVLLRKAKAAA